MIVRTEKDLQIVLKELENAEKISFDTEYVSYGYPDIQWVGCSASWDGKNGCYIPVGHNTGETQLPPDVVAEALKPILENQNKLIICHNVQAEIKCMWLQGVYIQDSEYWNNVMKPFKAKRQDFFYKPNTHIPQVDYSKGKFKGYKVPKVENHIWDTMIASWLLNTDRECGHGLKELVYSLFGIKMTELGDLAKKEYCPRIDKKVMRPDKVPIDMLGDYAWADAVYTYKLYEYFEPLIRKEGFEKIFYELEMHFVKVLAEMEIVGTPINKKLLEQLGEKIKTKIEESKAKIYECRPNKELFNINSSQQLSKVLFEELGIEPLGEKGKNGCYSTSKSVLEKLNWRYKFYLQGKKNGDKKCEIAKYILDYREADKLYGTYIVGMGNKVKADGRLHTNFGRHKTRTGRLSSSEPNLQNIPNNKEYPIRECFYAPTKEYAEKWEIPFNEPFDWVWDTQDFSQIELRVLAHVSRDENMIEVYVNDGDIHSKTAHGCFKLDCPVEEVKEKYPRMRSKAKPVNFGVIYGIGKTSLEENINSNLSDPKDWITKEEAKKLIEGFLNTYPRVKKYIQYCHDKVHKEGKVKTILGRYRHLPDGMLDPYKFKHDKKKMRDAFIRRSKAERMSQNSPIQGSAADIMAVAMRNIRNEFMATGEWFTYMQMVLQVHDELSFLFQKGKEREYHEKCKYLMETAVKLRVPIKAEGSWGENWWECK